MYLDKKKQSFLLSNNSLEQVPIIFLLHISEVATSLTKINKVNFTSTHNIIFILLNLNYNIILYDK